MNAFEAQQKLMLAIQNLQSGELEQARVSLLDLSEKFPKSDQVWSLLGIVFFSEQKYKEAFRSFKKSLECNPENPDALVNIASVEKARGKVKEAFAYAEHATKKLPDRADVHFNLANLHLDESNLVAAKKGFQRAIELNPSLIQAYINLAMVHERLGNYQAAEDMLKKVLEINPDLKEVYLNLGQLASSRGDYANAEKYFKQAGDSAGALEGLSHVYAEEEHPSDQEQSFDKALSLDEKDTDAMIHLANALNDQGKVEEAQEYFKKVLALEPGSVLADLGLRRILSRKIPHWHFPMLADSARNGYYDQAISKVINKDTKVLDIGTGSGLLAMMAARAGALSVVACEMQKDLAEAAKDIVKANGYDQQISIRNKKSTDLQVGEELPDKVDVVVSEILDCGGLGEGVLPSLRHAQKHLAKPGAIMIPAGISLYGMLIEIPSRHVINPMKEISGFDLSAFDRFRISNQYEQVYLKHEDFKPLTEIFKLRDYDFHNIPEPCDIQSPEKRVLTVSASDKGKIHAVAFWFDLHLDDKITVNSGPSGELKHWGQAIYYFENGPEIKLGQSIELAVLCSDWMLQFEI